MNDIRSFVLLFSLFVSGCATMKVSDFSTLEYEKTSSQEFKSKHGDPLTELAYRIGSNNYKYHTYETSDLPRGLEVLFKDEMLIAVSYIPVGRFAHTPPYRRCTIFPLTENDDPYKCLTELTEEALRRRLDLRDPGTAPKKGKAPFKDGTVAGAVELAAYGFLFSPLLPIFGAAAAVSLADETVIRAGKPDVAVGTRKEDLTAFLAALPEHAISRSGNDMSVLVPGGLFRNPTIALGLHEDIVIWVDKRPLWACPETGIEGCRLGGRPRASAQTSPEPQGSKGGYAIVYVYSCFRQAWVADISLDAKKLLTLKPGSFTWLYVPAGEHVVSATWPALLVFKETRHLKLNASAGQSYFFNLYPTTLTTTTSSGVIQTRGMALEMSYAGQAVRSCEYKEPLPIG